MAAETKRRAWPGLQGLSERSRDALAIGGIVVLIAVVYARTLFLGQVLYFGDTQAAFYPWMTFMRQMRLAGTWLPWCPLASAGYPVWQNGQSGPFDLLNLLFLLPFGPAWLFAFETLLRSSSG